MKKSLFVSASVFCLCIGIWGAATPQSQMKPKAPTIVQKTTEKKPTKKAKEEDEEAALLHQLSSQDRPLSKKEKQLQNAKDKIKICRQIRDLLDVQHPKLIAPGGASITLQQEERITKLERVNQDFSTLLSVSLDLLIKKADPLLSHSNFSCPIESETITFPLNTAMLKKI